MQEEVKSKFVCLFVYYCIQLFIRTSVCLSVCSYVRPSVCAFAHSLYFWPYVHSHAHSLVCLSVCSFVTTSEPTHPSSFVRSVVCLTVHPHACSRVCSSALTPIYSSVYFCIHSFLNRFFIHSVIHSFFIHSLKHSFIHVFFFSFVHSFFRLFICPFIHLLVDSFVS